MRSRMSAGISTAARMRATALVSSSRQLSRIAARNDVAGGGGLANTITMLAVLSVRCSSLVTPASAARPSSLLSAQGLGRTGGPEAAMRRLSIALTKFTGTPVPQRSLLRIAAQTVQASAVEKRRIVGHRHAHRSTAVPQVGRTLEEEPGRGDVARGEESVASCHESGGLGSRQPRT